MNSVTVEKASKNSVFCPVILSYQVRIRFLDDSSRMVEIFH